MATVDVGVEGAVPPGLSGERPDVEPVVAPTKTAFLGQESIRHNGLGRQPGKVVAAAVRKGVRQPMDAARCGHSSAGARH
ncbi:MAG: hypothetical protein O2782_15230 [bacterium]|nr:hypothetical protein [bacterium]